jgi:AcrR family transcriptional regulator
MESTATSIAVRPLRADALRNRARLLAVAQAVFAEQGVSAPIDEIARRAEVGVGTLYRHFPTKYALFEAIVVGRVEAQVEEARALLAAADPADAFFSFVGRMIEVGAHNKALTEELANAGFDVKAAVAGPSAELRRLVDELMARARDAGAVRSDVEVGDLMALLGGTCVAALRYGGDPGRLARIVCDGLRARPAEPA